MFIAITLHLLAVVVWVGGMFFAYMALRPVAAGLLEPPLRMPLWSGTFERFFPWVWAAVLLIVGSGAAMMVRMGAAPHYVVAMMGIGLVMALIFLHLYFAPYGRLKRTVAARDWQAAAAALGQIRVLVGVNLTLGLINVAVAILGRLA